jgi:formylglycine-generating enzyme required for sulfatase activity
VRAVAGCTGWRLPSQDEWTYAARAGEVGAVPGGALVLRAARDAPALEPVAWYGGNSGVTSPEGVPCGDWPGRPPDAQATRCGTQPVGGKVSNAWGLHDVLGNVAEWTDTGSGTGPEAVRGVRGGSWRSEAVATRFAAVERAVVTFRADDLGFRRCRSVP